MKRVFEWRLGIYQILQRANDIIMGHIARAVIVLIDRHDSWVGANLAVEFLEIAAIVSNYDAPISDSTLKMVAVGHAGRSAFDRGNDIVSGSTQLRGQALRADAIVKVELQAQANILFQSAGDALRWLLAPGGRSFRGNNAPPHASPPEVTQNRPRLLPRLNGWRAWS